MALAFILARQTNKFEQLSWQVAAARSCHAVGQISHSDSHDSFEKLLSFVALKLSSCSHRRVQLLRQLPPAPQSETAVGAAFGCCSLAKSEFQLQTHFWHDRRSTRAGQDRARPGQTEPSLASADHLGKRLQQLQLQLQAWEH